MHMITNNVVGKSFLRKAQHLKQKYILYTTHVVRVHSSDLLPFFQDHL